MLRLKAKGMFAPYASRAALVAAISAGLAPVEDRVYFAGDLMFQGRTGSTAISDLPGLVPASTVYARHFGARENYVPATDSGTDDLAAINAALAYLATVDVRISGGVVVIKGQAVVTGPINLPVGAFLEGFVSPASSNSGQIIPSTFPITYDRSSAIIGSHTNGPIVRAQFSQSGARDLTLGATEARRAATIGTADNWNGGIMFAGPDLDTNPQIFYAKGTRLCIQDQPADALVICGQTIQFEMEDVEVLNCGRHAFVIDNGEGIGRVNKYRPGIGRMINCRAKNTGGHALVIGNPNSGSDIPYRVFVDSFESFRAGNVGASLYISAACYCAAENIIFQNCAVSSTSGTSGTVPTLTWNYAIAGRDILFLSGRYISHVSAAIRIMDYTAIGNRGIRVIGGHASTQQDPKPTNFVSIEAGCFLRMLQIDGITGDFTSNPISRTGLDASWTIQETYNETIWSHGFEFENISTTPILDNNGITSGSFSLADNAAVTIPIALNGATAVFGKLLLSANVAAALPSTVDFRLGSSPYVLVTGGSATARTGALNGTTGVDGNLSVSADGSNFRIENRTGALRTYGFTITSLTSIA